MSGAQSPLRTVRDDEVVAVGLERAVIAFDPDGEVWFVRTGSVPGLRAEADSREALLDSLPGLIRIAKTP